MRCLAVGLFALTLLSAAVSAADLKEPMPVNQSGVTKLSGKHGQKSLEVLLETSMIKADRKRDCIGDVRSCSSVKNISLRVGGKAIRVPNSIYCGLTEVRAISYDSGKDGVILNIYGGDASESYIVRIEFDKRVTRKSLFSDLEPDKPTEVIQYNEVVLGD